MLYGELSHVARPLARTKSPYIAYRLAVVYRYYSTPRWATELLIILYLVSTDTIISCHNSQAHSCAQCQTKLNPNTIAGLQICTTSDGLMLDAIALVCIVEQYENGVPCTVLVICSPRSAVQSHARRAVLPTIRRAGPFLPAPATQGKDTILALY